MPSHKERTGKTRIGKALEALGEVGKPILSVLGDAIPGASVLGDVASAITTNKDIEEAKKQELLHLVTLDMKDVAQARQSTVEIQRSQFSSWMAKNMPYLYESFIILIWGSLTIYIAAVYTKLIDNQSADMTGIWGMYAAVTSLVTQAMNFHRGSSMGSRMKDLKQ